MLLGITWKQLGFFNILLVTLGLVYLAAHSVREGRFSPLLLAAYYGLGIFTLAHCMHERYMVPGVLLTLLAAAHWDDIRLYAAGFGMSLTGFLNLSTVYSLTGSDDEWLTSATSSSVAILVGLAETVCFVLLLFAVWDIVVHDHALPLPARKAEETAPPAIPAPQPKWQRKELLAMLALTAATAVVSFTYLGSLTAPQSPLDAADTTLTESVTLQGDTAALWVYPGISYGGRMTVTDAAGTTVYEKELDYSTYFSWTSVELYADAGEVFHITVENAQLFELAFRDADGALVPVTGGGALFDEQDAVPEAISQLNSMYFDEIYHGRTGYEQLHRLPVYETTHPPLGKDFIMLGIALFGMTAFGWRFAGTLFGVLLVPLAWCFVRRLTRRPWAAAMAGVLLALDLWAVPRAENSPFLNVVALFSIGIRMMLPCIITGAYAFSTTTAGELVCALRSMHVPESVIIPCAVVIRFFPTVGEDYRQIRAAMALRGIAEGKAALLLHPAQSLEYILMPLLMNGNNVAQDLSVAALTKGIGLPGRHTSMIELCPKAADILYSLLCTLPMLLFWGGVL